MAVNEAAREIPYFGAPEMVGQPAPDFDMQLLNGKNVSLADHRDKQRGGLGFLGDSLSAVPRGAAQMRGIGREGIVTTALSSMPSTGKIAPNAFRTTLLKPA